MKQISLPFVAAFLFLLPAGLHAQEIQTYPTLPCQGVCPEYTPAKVLAHTLPIYDSDKMAEAQESAVLVDYTIGLDGRVKNPIVESVAGGKNFVNAVLEALNGYVYQPATENGKPIEENKQMMFVFMFPQGSSAHLAVASLYHDALAKKDDPRAAIASLKAINSRTEMNLYEATMIANALALLETQIGDYEAAQQDITTATLSDGRFLDVRQRAPALRLRITLAVRAHQYADAFSAFDALKKLEDVPGTDATAQMIANLHAEIDSPKPMWADAQVPANGPIPVWSHTMLRRSFGFADIKGSLSKFHLRCETHGIESPVTDSATWNIPPSWTKCNILVEGTPGTTFKFGEAQPDATAASSQHP